MIRLEIYANRSVEEDLFDGFKKAGVAQYYTKIPVVHGVGSSGPRMGDAIWPEENFALIIWCEDQEAQEIAKVVEDIKEKFPHEGIKLFKGNF